MKWQEILPVILSIVVIILIAVLEKQSKFIAAITATMPLTVPLALWIVYSSVGGDRASVTQFAQAMLLGIIPTIGFVITVWLASRAGLKIAPMILFGYFVWGIGSILIFALRNRLGL